MLYLFHVYQVFAFGESYNVLLVARALQGAGSACSSVSGFLIFNNLLFTLNFANNL